MTSSQPAPSLALAWNIRGAAVGHCIAYDWCESGDEFGVGPGAEGVVHGGEGDAERDEGGDGEDLVVVESGVAQCLDIVDGGPVGVMCDGAGPVGQGAFGRVQR